MFCRRLPCRICAPAIALVFLLTTGCAAVPPTATPIPTPIPVDASIVSAMSPIVSGQRVPGAAVHNPDEPGPHHVVLLTTSGTAYERWNEMLPSDWFPPSASEAELVVLIGPERERALETRLYTSGNVTAYSFEADIDLREARTGQTLATATLTGSDPRPFPQSVASGTTRLDGSHFVYWTLEDWLCPSVIAHGCWVPLRTLEYHGQVSSVAFSPDGQILASGSSDYTVCLWRVSDGALLRTLEGHADRVSSVAFSPDGQMLASGSVDTVRLWRVSDGALLRSLEGYGSVAFSPDGQTLAAGSSDYTVRLWRVSDGALLRSLEGHTRLVSSVAFSPDGQILAAGGVLDTVRLWHVSDGSLLPVLSIPEGVTDVAFSPDGQTLAIGSNDGTVRLRQVR